jgi:hypothetical protein
MLLYQGVGLGQCLEAIFRVAQVVRDFCQYDVKPWDCQRCPSGLVSRYPTVDLYHSLLALALHGQRPPA